MEQWRESFPGDILTEREFYAVKREERRAERRRRWDFIYDELDKPSSALDENDPRWDDICGRRPPPPTSSFRSL
jgi:hypothetical protein